MKLSLPIRLRLVSAVFVISAILFSSFFAGNTYAEAAFPKSGEIPCDKEKDPEYSSDRPYQASPCEEAPVTYFCGNTVKIDLGNVSTPYDPATCGSGANPSCPVDIHRDQSIVVDLTNVQLPILGNTQLTINSQSPDDQIDDPTKVNNFVAWYLNGTNDKAEYPAVDATTRAGISQVIDTSGPIKKLLPSAILDAQRYDTIITASKTQKPYIQSTFDLQEGSDPQNHNQIVVCTTHNIFGINNPWIGAEKPIPCYEGVNNPAQGKPYRLKDWGEGNLSIFNTFFNFLGAQKWDNKYPPLPWQFTSNLYYQKAYREWKGATCIIVPVFNTLACASIPILSPNRTWSDLYPYIPLANTVDKKGMQKIKSVDINAPQAAIDQDTKVIDIIHNPQLYLAHSLENYSLTNTLKTTYVPSTVTLANTKGYPGASTPSTVENNSSECRIIDSRTNPGDYATFSKPKSFINVHVIYDITSIECSTPKYTCLTDPITQAQYSCGWHATCRSSVTAVIPSDSLTPYADEIWGNTVAGSDSIFQRIYPKVGADAPVTCIADIPAVSTATYKLEDTSIAQGLSLTEVVEPDGLTSFTGDGVKIAAQLYFPHYGGVLDYFLKGIQTALRPQGYGPPTPLSGQYCVAPITCGGIAQQYGVPSCLIDAILFLESGSTLSSPAPSTGTESCGTESCCTLINPSDPNSEKVCGPAQIKCGLYGGLSAGQNIKMCDPCGSAELMSRLLLLKKCQAKGVCNSYDWSTMKDKALQFKITTTSDAATAACYYYGQSQGCSATACTQYRWGTGKSYGDAVTAICNNNPLPTIQDMSYCADCAKEDPRLQCVP